MSNYDFKPLLDLYSTTVFLCSKPIHFSNFAIITANNPNGKVMTSEVNKKLNDLLKQQINKYGFVELIGASPDLTHQEPSFAVDISQNEAVKLAKQFNQNAIFWVTDGEVFIVSAGLNFNTIKMDSFFNRCRFVS